MGHASHKVWMVLAIVLLFSVVLVGQSLADSAVPAATSTGTQEAVGRASFAYLTGIRVFIAEVLWNRIDPILHEYYSDVPLRKQTYMLTTFNAITLLDPKFAPPYYIGPWILAREDEPRAALDLAAQGVENIPDSGLLRSSYAQMLLLYGDDLDLAVKQADIAAGDSVSWADAIEQHDAYGILRFVYLRAGMQAKADALLVTIEELDAQIGDQLPEEGHDHDGDGKPDH